MTDVFDGIYRRNLWHGVESRSGPGSGPVATARLREDLPRLAADLGVESVLDVACGDGYWMPDLPGYVGIDVAAAAIRLARARHPGRAYHVADVRDAAPFSQPFGLVLLRDVVQHLPLADAIDVLEAIRATGSRWLLASTFVDGVNVEIAAGDAYRPDLTAPPFGLPQPCRWIPDGYDYEYAEAIRDPGKFLGLWAL